MNTHLNSQPWKKQWSSIQLCYQNKNRTSKTKTETGFEKNKHQTPVFKYGKEEEN